MVFDALCTNEFMTKMARRHNDANMLQWGLNLAVPYALTLVGLFLEEPFENWPSSKAIDQIAEIEKGRLT